MQDEVNQATRSIPQDERRVSQPAPEQRRSAGIMRIGWLGSRIPLPRRIRSHTTPSAHGFRRPIHPAPRPTPVTASPSSHRFSAMAHSITPQASRHVTEAIRFGHTETSRTPSAKQRKTNQPPQQNITTHSETRPPTPAPGKAHSNTGETSAIRRMQTQG
jgi:hypothetical protein